MSVAWEDGALADLEAIGAYLRQQSPRGARRVIAFIIARAESLDAMPYIGRPSADPGLRELVLSKYPYTVAYDVGALDQVRILSITHQMRDR